MDQSLGYLREILAGYTENDAMGKRIFDKISNRNYVTEGQFVEDLTQVENNYLNRVLVDAIKYANQEQDAERAHQLNEVYELLFI
ncbi:sigma-G-dependent sporulation-specific acid-soluble spore protein CsgA [Peribacillus asahii]|uniref:Sporulation protein n=1 Tax=Peribacillus asahii TaxID=228899 RepID=A0A3Q9RKX9_9BACI|nr:sigma-G-dependent sporulation-specific acid-soluble spore protein CsgA [Peribacillus asahii]AZV41938.1 sporulation protein [Peribacillus asahii]USK60933.1 sigma-G-dependent sporulation-specific acid-soluble spore protein CsgA [Peribacillus asahii]USK86300.1 sigma-G-dependent sporulation-specific acid-soluble spore protein CsgA [Peribacillus asahii]